MDNMIITAINGFNEKFSNSERALETLFEDNHTNDNPDTVRMKVVFLNKLYGTRLINSDIEILVQQICDFDELDYLLINGDIKAVDVIGKRNNKSKSCFVFASKYCSFHQPDLFPIYDYYSRKALYDLSKHYNFTYIEKRSELNEYRKYVDHIEKLKAFLDAKYGYKKLDEFLWMYGKGYVQEIDNI